MMVIGFAAFGHHYVQYSINNVVSWWKTTISYFKSYPSPTPSVFVPLSGSAVLKSVNSCSNRACLGISPLTLSFTAIRVYTSKYVYSSLAFGKKREKRYNKTFDHRVGSGVNHYERELATREGIKDKPGDDWRLDQPRRMLSVEGRN